MVLAWPTSTIRGFSLVELLIAMAIIAILSAIAIPAYNSYIREGHFTTLRADMDSLRVPIEDYRLENATYAGVTAELGVAAIMTDINSAAYTFTVSPTTNSYTITGVYNPRVWVRCENRMNTCCYADPDGTTLVTSACP